MEKTDTQRRSEWLEDLGDRCCSALLVISGLSGAIAIWALIVRMTPWYVTPWW
ncbi:hypothetical protein SAMN05518800_6945 [Variovorax sp. YR752]|uniref:hypothetical protein n=1 Tax=unclassified Variovorax TaxID=663243 RepID=UPI000BCC5909|nr:hypothetical protein [Variovorax sp. YR752]SOE06308.1 hypothetical protein SAMN05518800_6945 [Variovorax sp. YR752]